MGSLAAEYCEQVHRHFKVVHATFLPNAKGMLGDFGALDDDVFVRLGNIRDLGLTFDVRVGTAKSNPDFSSAGSVEFIFTAGGTVAGVVASLEINFSSKHAVVFNAAECTLDEIENKVALGDAILELVKQKKWPKGQVVVTSLVMAKSTTAIVSSSSSASITLEASSPDVANIDLTDANLKLVVKRQKDLALKLVTENDCTPLIGLAGPRGAVRTIDELGPFGAMVGPERGVKGPEEKLVFLEL